MRALDLGRGTVGGAACTWVCAVVRPLGRAWTGAAVLVSMGLLTACAGTAWMGTQLDPAQISFAEETGVDLAEMEQIEPGLYSQDLAVGMGAAAGRSSRVWIHYVVQLPDGSVVDSSVGGEPFHFRLGEREVIKGWNAAIPGMKIGGRRKLVVRPGLAYGSAGTSRVPPNATLIFEVQLVDAR